MRSSTAYENYIVVIRDTYPVVEVVLEEADEPVVGIEGCALVKILELLVHFREKNAD